MWCHTVRQNPRKVTILNTGVCRAMGLQALLVERQARDTLKDAWKKKTRNGEIGFFSSDFKTIFFTFIIFNLYAKYWVSLWCFQTF